MRFRDYMRLGWDQLKRRVVVTALCIMGIAIGSASIVVALAFGESINHYSRMQMSFYLKSDEITVRSGHGGDESDSGDPNAAKPYVLTKAKIDLIRGFPHVKALGTYQTLNNFQFLVDNKRGYINSLYATELETLPDFGFELHQGGPSDQDNTIILSYGATMGLFDQQLQRSRQLQNGSGLDGAQAAKRLEDQMYIAYPMYQKQIVLTPQIYKPNLGTEESGTPFPLRVVGILKKPEGVPDDVVMNQKTAFVSPALGQKLLDAMEQKNGKSSTGSAANRSTSSGTYNEVKIKVDDSSHVKELEQWIKKLKLSVETNLYREERMQSELVIIRLIFGGVGVFILFVASISIIVAMTMSTYQRRRQIGIMKVLGANLRQIRNMFMVESALLGLLGGMTGILLSYWVIWGINIAVMKLAPARPGAQQEILFISPWILPVGLFFAIMTGVLSGIYPAVKASRTDALTAIKRD
ncbi:ABC transporter permease YtrF [Paenibacillus solanacearum]|uniref:ABC transporter permease YtrF n=1 Tax=Paenibacillus solanacearum TaxID=2048548 RepID=A0A916K272_9BACL|nr:ABC transporter permease [Paenibacillus solanacearum]CAG7625270.1 ABC transporter permease YtrF [Paenibacillus solanacearum]